MAARSRRLEQLVTLSIGITLAVVFVWSQRPHPFEGETPVAEAVASSALRLGRSKSIEIPVVAEAVGTVQSRRQTVIASRLLAEVLELRKDPGDQVAAGETVAVLDARDLVARVEGSEATLAARRHAKEEANTELTRARNLRAKEAVTDQQVELATFRSERVTAELTAAEKALEEARVQRSFAEVKAPFAGEVFRRDVDPGDLATPGRALLGLYDRTQLRLEVRVEESLIWRLSVGQELRVDVDAVGASLAGRVSEVVPAIDPVTRTGTVKIDLPASPNIGPGMYGRAHIQLDRREAIVVPESAVLRRGQLEFVYVVENPESTRSVRLVLVRIGQVLERDGALWLEVLSGLGGDVEIVVEGTDRVRDGTRIE